MRHENCFFEVLVIIPEKRCQHRCNSYSGSARLRPRWSVGATTPELHGQQVQLRVSRHAVCTLPGNELLLKWLFHDAADAQPFMLRAKPMGKLALSRHAASLHLLPDSASWISQPTMAGAVPVPILLNTRGIGHHAHAEGLSLNRRQPPLHVARS